MLYSRVTTSHITTKPHQSPNIIVWMGVWSGELIGPFMFDATVSGERYLKKLRDCASPTQQLSCFNNSELFCQQDGAPPHWSRAMRDWLDATFVSSWIERGSDQLAAAFARPDAKGLLSVGRSETPEFMKQAQLRLMGFDVESRKKPAR